MPVDRIGCGLPWHAALIVEFRVIYTNFPANFPITDFITNLFLQEYIYIYIYAGFLEAILDDL